MEHIWHDIQGKMASEAFRKSNSYGIKEGHILSGLLKCPVCGAVMYGRAKSMDNSNVEDRDWIYFCKHRHLVGDKLCDYSENITQNEIDSELCALMRLAFDGEGDIDKLLVQKINDNDRKISELIESKTKLTEEYTQLLVERDYFLSCMTSSDTDNFIHNEIVKEYGTRLEKIKERISVLEKDIDDTDEAIRNTDGRYFSNETITALPSFADGNFYKLTPYQLKDIIDSFVKTIEIFPEKQNENQWIKSVKLRHPLNIFGNIIDVIDIGIYGKTNSQKTICQNEEHEKITIIGAGLAGCEAAWQAANRGVKVDIYEMKPKKYSPAHKYGGFAELVCSNSLKASRLASAAGLLKEEMLCLGSLIVQCAKRTAVAAGGALAVDREKFSDMVTEKIKSHKNITVHSEEITEIPKNGVVIVATGPLTSDTLAENIKSLLGSEYLSFHDAAAPIVSFESLDTDKVFFAARYGRGDDDYINCPMNREEYEAFYNELVNAEAVQLKEFEKNMTVYEGCMPVEVMAKRGEDTLRFGPLKPVGLKDPRTGHRPWAVVQLRRENADRPWAVVQLRRENADGTLYNMVGFQTNLKFPEQKRVFSMIPGLENAQFMRYGVMHRNTFIDSPRLLDATNALRQDSRIFFAGQITGVEGYIESAASGIVSGINAVNTVKGRKLNVLPKDTMLGALLNYISDSDVIDFQPMGCNMGILPPNPVRIKDKAQRYLAVAERALDKMKSSIDENSVMSDFDDNGWL